MEWLYQALEAPIWRKIQIQVILNHLHCFLLRDDQRLITLSIIIVSVLGCGVIYYQSCFLEEY